MVWQKCMLEYNPAGTYNQFNNNKHKCDLASLNIRNKLQLLHRMNSISTSCFKWIWRKTRLLLLYPHVWFRKHINHVDLLVESRRSCDGWRYTFRHIVTSVTSWLKSLLKPPNLKNTSRGNMRREIKIFCVIADFRYFWQNCFVIL